jgi:hypothetical protein
MQAITRELAKYVAAEIALARHADAAGDAAAAFHHLERAHILGQNITRLHVRVHMLMFAWAIRHRARREAMGQIVRIIGAATKTAFGLVPAGNSGGTNVSPFQKMPIAEDLQQLLSSAQKQA